MADAVVSVFLQNLIVLVDEETNLVGGVKGQVASLRREVEIISGFLTEAEKKRKVNCTVDTWVRQIIDLAYDAQDAIDLYNLHLEQNRNTRIWRKLILCYCGQIWTLRQIGKQIEELTCRSKEISDHRSRYSLDVSVSEQPQDPHGSWTRRRSNPAIEEPGAVIVGLSKEADLLSDWLIKDEKDDEPQHRVMSIIGMGGVGKTTLAKHVYNHKNVQNHFHVRAWVYVSQECRVKDILSKILKQLGTDVKEENMDDEELELLLQNTLQGKRYLVVIDDIWKPEAWDLIGGAFPHILQIGSRILLTTRNKDVALHADPLTRNHYELPLLKEAESWELLRNKVFPSSSSSSSSSSSASCCTPELVEVGKQIAEKCGGLPLAIVVIGGVLIGKERTHQAWSKVLASVNWQLSQDSNPCREVLSVSYTELPLYLKPCFLYLGLYPEDYLIAAEQLILLWVAEGFVQGRGGEEKLEDVAYDYLDELIQRSMIQLEDRKYHGGQVLSCRVHDLLRDVAITEARKDRFLETLGSNSVSNNPLPDTRSRRLAIHSYIQNGEYANLFHNSTITSMLNFDGRSFTKATLKSAFGQGIKMLRVLSLDLEVTKKGLPKDIGKLIFLQYLALRGTAATGRVRLPTSIGNLIKLQTLDLRLLDLENIHGVSFIRKMKRLRHLFFEPLHQDEFSSIGDVKIEHFSKDLLTLHLPSSIWMSMDGKISEPDQFKSLRSMRLEGEIILNQTQRLSDCFPSSLVELDLINCCLKEDPSIVFGSLPKLEILQLGMQSYTGCSMAYQAGQFDKLRALYLSCLGSLQELRLEDGALRNLNDLGIFSCDELKMLPDGLEKVTTLRQLRMHVSPEFKERVDVHGEDWGKIKHVPSITVNEQRIR